MTTRIAVWSVAACLLVYSAAPAATAVGDKPKLQFKDATSGQMVDLAALKGKLVLVDFWATWCGPCMDEADHMVRINETYKSKGLLIIGISLDQSAAAMARVVKEKHFAWPQYFDGQVWKNAYAVAWGVNGIPQTFLIGPEGDVLWMGHPAALDSVLEKAFKEHPPQLVDPKVLADANSALDAVAATLEQGKVPDALRQLARIPAAAKADPAFAQRSGEIAAKLEDAGKSLIAEVDPLIEQKQYPQAIARLREISAALGESPLAKEARQKLTALSARPEVKAAVDAADRATKAEDALAVAHRLQQSKTDEEAYVRYKEILKLYADTPSAPAAAEAVKAYEADSGFMQRYNEKLGGAKAKSLLSIADSYRSGDRMELARKKYQEVIDQFPNTPYAETARKALQAIDKR